MSEFTELCKKLEHFETPEWAAREILKHECFPPGIVLDPCTGTGILAGAAVMAGYQFVYSIDIHDWQPIPELNEIANFLDWSKPAPDDPFSVFMNPPFSKACDFVEKSFDLGARKIVCFQRFAWWESAKRREWWVKFPPNRIYICGDRASCWRHDIPHDQRGSGTPTAHAWFVWEKGQPAGTQLGHIYKGAA